MSGKDLFMSISAFMLSVLACVLAFFGLYATIGLVCAIISIILSSLQIKAFSNALVVTALVLAILGTICSIFGIGCGILCTAIAG